MVIPPPVDRKRRLIEQLPTYHQNPDLKNFFGSTIDQVFQPGDSQPISGYIGRRPTTTDDFYVGEPDAERAVYQLESAMVSYSATGALIEKLTYPDFVGYLQTIGADVSDHQRMFETEYYTWAPPINYDMLINHRNYYWFGDEFGAIDLPILVLTVPVTNAIGDGLTTTYPLPRSIRAVAANEETPMVWVNGRPVAFTIDGNDVVVLATPDVDAVILIARVPDLATIISHRVTVDISDLNSDGVSTLSSGMRIRIYDAFAIINTWDYLSWDSDPWDYTRVYMVDAIGQSLRLTDDSDLIRGIEPQYVTIDRSSQDQNLWSLHNLWVHKDTVAWYKGTYLQPLATRQATRPIIEFIRDIVLYPNQIWNESADPLFMLYDLHNIALDDPISYPNSTFAGNRIFGFDTGNSVDSVLRRSLKIDPNGYIIFTNATVTETDHYSYADGAITGLFEYATWS